MAIKLNKPFLFKLLKDKRAILFSLAFGVVASIFLYTTFAATSSVSYSGTLSATTPQATYSITTGNGTLTAALNDKTADLMVTIKNSSGTVVATATNNGKRSVSASADVTPGTYTAVVTYPTTFLANTRKKNFNITISYPLQDTTMPTAVITNPLDGSAISGTVQFSANANDDTGISKVELYVNNNLLSSVTTAPYQTTWDSTQTANGAAVLMAKAYDTSGNVSSASETVVVNNLSSTSVDTVSLDLTATPAQVSNGGTVTVALNINTGTILTDGTQTVLTYDPTKLTYVGIAYDGSPLTSSAPDFSATNGRISLTRYTSTPPGPSGNILVANITFTALSSTGSTTVTIDKASSYVSDHSRDGANVLSVINPATILFK